MQIDRSGIFCNHLCQIHDLLLCALARIWRRMEIGCIDVQHRALQSCILPPGCRFRRISSSIAFPFVPTGIPPGPGIIVEYTLILVADLNIKHHLRIDVHPRFVSGNASKILSPMLRIDLHGLHRVILSRTAGIDLKRKMLVRVYLVDIARSLPPPASSKPSSSNSTTGQMPDDTEHMLQCLRQSPS